MPPNLSATLDRLGTSGDHETYDEAGAVHEIVKAAQARSRSTLSAEDLEPEEIRAWLFSVDIPAEATVVVLWPANRLGARMTYQSFVDNYDDLWYPASDDVIVYGENGDVVILDHEEEFTFGVLAKGRES